MIVDALRHWAREYNVDGFVIANAENLAQVDLIVLSLALGAVFHVVLHLGWCFCFGI